MSIADSSHEKFDGFDPGLDQICDEFEHIWKSSPNSPPSIADFIVRAPKRARGVLVYELVGVDLEFRWPDPNTRQSVDAYLKEWPELTVDRQKLAEIRKIEAELDAECDDSGDLEKLFGPSIHDNSHMHPSAPSTWAAGDQVDQFVLEEKLGAGSFGEVWKAKDAHLDRVVAIKFPKQRFRQQRVRTDFLREARAAARSQHPNIVRVHQVRRVGDSIYIVTDYVDGPNLADWISLQTPHVTAAVELVTEVAEALAHAHENGIVHRDIKPANILVKVGSDGRSIPVVTDFGLAFQCSEESNWQDNVVRLGSPAYMSPEQAKGESNRVDFRADIFSLGVVLFELITGERPFRGSSSAILQQVIHEPTPDPRSLNRAVDKDLATICQKCLEKSPARRYANAREVANDLRRWMAGEPILARPIDPIERGYRWAIRHPLESGLAFLVFASLVLGLAGVSYQWQRAEEKSQELKEFLYVGEMNLVQQAWHQGNQQAGLSLLEKQRPKQGDADLRGFAWHHWSERFRNSQQVFKLGFAIRDIDVSPDRKLAMAVGDEGKVAIVELMPPQLRACWDGHQNGIRFGGFVDNDRFVTGGKNGTLRLWDANTLNCLQEVDLASPISAFDIALGKDEIAVGCMNATLWSISKDLQEKKSIMDVVHPAGAIAFSSTGDRLAIATCEGGPLFVVDLAEPRTVKAFEESIAASEVRWSDDDSQLAIAGLDSTCKIVDVETGHVTTVASRPWLSVTGAAFTSDGNSIWICGDDTFLQKYHCQSGELQDKLIGHENTVTAMVVLEEEFGRILSGSRDGTIREWQLKHQASIASPPLHNDSVKSVDFSPDGKTLASVGYDSTIVLYDVEASKPQLEIDPPERTRRLCVRFSHDGKTLATADYLQQTVSVWDATSSVLLNRFACNRTVDSVVFSPDDSLVIAGCADGQIQFWELRSGKLQATLHAHDGQAVFSMDVAPEQDLLATGGWDGTTMVWHLETRRIRHTLECSSRVFGVRFSPDGKELATTRLREATLWSVESGKPITTFRGHTHSVNVPDFSPDGNLLATAGWDGMVKLWDLRTHTEIASLAGHSNGVAFSPNGKYLASAGTSKPHVTIWRAAEGDERAR